MIMSVNIYPTSNAEAQMTHAAWDASPCMDDEAYARWERDHDVPPGGCSIKFDDEEEEEG